MAKISEEQVKRIVDALEGLNYTQWCLVQRMVKHEFSSRAGKMVIGEAFPVTELHEKMLRELKFTRQIISPSQSE